MQACIHSIKVAIVVLSHGYHLNGAVGACSGAVGVDLGQVDRVYLVDRVEIVVGVYFHVCAWKRSAHESLGVLHVPWRAV